MTITIFDEECMLWSSTLCSVFQSPATSSLLDPCILHVLNV
jgi:hypothetical protein